jgi:hypothetical protein
MNWDWIKNRWFEFRQGHGIYLGFSLSLVNFVLITYNLFLVRFTTLGLLEFCVLFGLIYLPGAIIVGHWHIRKQLGTDQGRIFEQNPWANKMIVLLEEIREAQRNAKPS